MIEDATSHTSERVRREALRSLAELAPDRCAAHAKRLAEQDEAVAIRLYAIDRLLELTSRGHRMPDLVIAADDESRRWAALARIAGDAQALGRELASAIASEDALATRALLLVRPETAGAKGVITALGERLAAGTTEARLAAAEAIIRAGIVVLVPAVVEQLGDRTLGPSIAQIIVRLAPRDAAPVSPIVDGSLSRLASRITRVADAASIDALVARLLVHPRISIRQHATRALASAIARKERHPLPAERVLEVLESDVRRAYHLADLAHRVTTLAPSDRAQHALVPPLTLEVLRTLDFARAELLPIVALLGHAELVGAVQAGRRRPSPSRDAQIAELLEASLPEPLRSMVVPLFDRLSHGRVAARGRALALAPDEDAPLERTLDVFDDPVFARLVTHVLLPTERGDEAMHALFDRLRLLRTVPLFRDLPTDEAFALVERLEEVHVPTGGVVFRRDEPGDALYVVVEGTCSMVVSGREVARFGRGEFFGELSLVDGEPRSTDAIAASDALLLRLRGTDFDEILVHRPDAIRGVVRVLAARLRAATRAPRT